MKYKEINYFNLYVILIVENYLFLSKIMGNDFYINCIVCIWSEYGRS